jgi:RNA polymerase sigma factor (sigma-70 family)
VVLGGADVRASDRELLRRFVERRDEDAFTALVRRHGGMVLSVGLRVLRHRQDAEDVCQATFLILARKAAATVWRDSVAAWLYGVASRLALKARQAALRRAAREGQARPRTPPDALAELTVRDLERVLDEELRRLPPKYRTPLILCCLEGKTRDEAARCLGVPLSTVSGRLEAAREALRRRLACRGVPLALALAGATLLPPAAVPAAWARAAGQAALQARAGVPLTNIVSPQVASLVIGGMRAMFLNRLQAAAALLLLAAVALAAVWAVLPGASAREAPPPVAPAAAERPGGEPKAQAGAPSTLLLSRQGEMVALSAEGKEGAKLTAPKGTHANFQGRLSPDGTHAAFIVTEDGPLRPPAPKGQAPEPWPFKVVVRKLGADKPAAVVDLPAQQLGLVWAPDGKRVLVSVETGAWPDLAVEHVLLDPATGKTEKLDLPAGVKVLDWSGDGKAFLVLHRQGKQYRLGLVPRGGQEVRELAVLKAFAGNTVARLSPDGKRVLYTDADPADKDAHKWGVSSKPYVLDVASKKRVALAEFPENGQATGLAWSPDGKRVAYTWKQLHPELLKKDSIEAGEVGIVTEAFLMVADADGRNARVVASGKGDNALNLIFGSVDWR